MAAASVAKSIVLITGANSGVGYGLAAELLAKGNYHVLLGARSAEKGQAAVKQLQSSNPPGSVDFLSIDVTKDDSIEAAAQTVREKHGKLDALVNNAAIAPTEVPLRQSMRESFDTNVTGPAVVVEAFASLLKASDGSPRIVNVSSGMGSITRRLDTSSPAYNFQAIEYRTSKAALMMATACHFVQYGPQIKVFGYDPGFTQSNLGPFNTAEKGARSASESAKGLIDVLEGKRDGEAGTHLHNSGVWPW